MKKREKTLKKNAHLKLNMELKGNQQKIKEETTMKKRTMVMMAIAMAFVLTACGTEPQQQPVVTTTPAPTVVEAKPTEAPVATEAPEPTEEPTPTEAPAPTESEYMVDEHDFAEYYESDARIEDVVQTWNDDSARIVVVGFKDVNAVLKDGDSFVMDESVGAYYSFYVIVPKKAVEATNGNEKFVNIIDAPVKEASNRDKLPYAFSIDDEETGTDVECPITITYEDGTEETITIYITKEYVAEF